MICRGSVALFCSIVEAHWGASVRIIYLSEKTGSAEERQAEDVADMIG